MLSGLADSAEGREEEGSGEAERVFELWGEVEVV